MCFSYFIPESAFALLFSEISCKSAIPPSSETVVNSATVVSFFKPTFE